VRRDKSPSAPRETRPSIPGHRCGRDAERDRKMPPANHCGFVHQLIQGYDGRSGAPDRNARGEIRESEDSRPIHPARARQREAHGDRVAGPRHIDHSRVDPASSKTWRPPANSDIPSAPRVTRTAVGLISALIRRPRENLVWRPCRHAARVAELGDVRLQHIDPAVQRPVRRLGIYDDGTACAPAIARTCSMTVR